MLPQQEAKKELPERAGNPLPQRATAGQGARVRRVRVPGTGSENTEEGAASLP